MEVIDFYRRSRRITDQLAPRISPEYRPIVLTAGGAGPGTWRSRRSSAPC
ncbi:hypothetical protein NKG94_22720 [Micromonospora sp. M12]